MPEEELLEWPLYSNGTWQSKEIEVNHLYLCKGHKLDPIDDELGNFTGYLMCRYCLGVGVDPEFGFTACPQCKSSLNTCVPVSENRFEFTCKKCSSKWVE